MENPIIAPLKKKSDLVRVCFLINKKTFEKVVNVQKAHNFNNRTAAIVEIINAYNE